MAPDPNKLSHFWQELKRRRVVHVIVVYATASFVIIELVNNVFETLNLPDWTPALVLIILAIGFPLAIIFSWIFDITREGIEKSKPSPQERNEEKSSAHNSWRVATYISFGIIVALVLFHILSTGSRSRQISQMEKSIAVLPFVNWSVGEEHSHMGNAIANEIITELSKVKDFHVISYTSSSRYKDTNSLSIPQIGRELGANFIIEGTVERQNDQVNIHVQVIQADNDGHMWADEFSGPWNNIFNLQDEIALKVADKLMTTLSPEEKLSIDEEPTRNPESYDHYIRGKSLYEENLTSLNDEAIYWFKESIKLDSTFALPWTHLSMVYWRESRGATSPKFLEAKRTAEKALELDPRSGTALVNLAEILDNEYNFVGAEEKINLALRIDPDNPYVLRNAGRFFTLLGRFDKGISFCIKALENDPTNPSALVYLVRAYFYAGDYTNTWKTIKRVNELGRRVESSINYQLFLEDGNLDQILNEPSNQNNEKFHSFGMAAAYMKSGNLVMAEKHLAKMKDRFSLNLNYFTALVFAYGNQVEEVCTWLEASFDARERMLTYLTVNPVFKKYLNEPGIKNILSQMRFPE